MSVLQTPLTTPVLPLAIPAVAPPPKTPRLENGDRLTRVEFERRYSAMPNIKKAELIEGIVYMPSPVRHTQHGKHHLSLCGWIAKYLEATPGLEGSDNATSRLDEDNEPQPDIVLMLPSSVGGTSRIEPDGYIAGAPDFVAEVAASSVSIDLHTKKNVYRRTGVREYLVVRTQDDAVDWFELQEGVYLSQQPDTEGIYKSQLFPGLWLDVSAAIANDLTKLFGTLDRGIASPEHAAFVQQLAAK
jgi:Uma2 family endonuclease